MPNWAYLLVTLVYNLSLAIWIGGTVALGALAAPTLFARLESRSKAGEVFGAILPEPFFSGCTGDPSW